MRGYELATAGRDRCMTEKTRVLRPAWQPPWPLIAAEDLTEAQNRHRLHAWPTRNRVNNTSCTIREGREVWVRRTDAEIRGVHRECHPPHP